MLFVDIWHVHSFLKHPIIVVRLADSAYFFCPNNPAQEESTYCAADPVDSHKVRSSANQILLREAELLLKGAAYGISCLLNRNLFRITFTVALTVGTELHTGARVLRGFPKKAFFTLDRAIQIHRFINTITF